MKVACSLRRCFRSAIRVVIMAFDEVGALASTLEKPMGMYGIRTAAAIAAAYVLAVSMVGCGAGNPDPPPPGWELKEVVPQSHQQAQDTLLWYLRRTLSALPPGTTLDSHGFASSGSTPWCEDEPKDPKAAPIHVVSIGRVEVPGGMDPAELIAKVGEAWRSWGWHVIERDPFRKPNQFGYGPDGYRLQIDMPNPPNYPPILQGISPCFSGELARSDLDFPSVIGGRG